MTEKLFQHKLDELRQQFSTLQQFSLEDSALVQDLLPGVLADLQRSLEDLRNISTQSSERETASSGSSGSGNGKHLRESRSARGLRFRALAERGPVLVRIMRNEARCLWANQAWPEFTGQDPEQMLGELWLQFVHPDDRDRCTKIRKEAFESNQLYRVEYRLQRKGGEYGWVLEIGIPRLTMRGTVSGYLGTAIEITEHKQAETHLALQYAVARVLSEAQTLEEAAPTILQTLCETLGWSLGELWTVDAQGQLPSCAHIWAAPSIEVSELEACSRTRAFPVGAGPSWKSGNAVWIPDITADRNLAREPEALRLGLHGMFRLPISVHGEVRAIVRVFSLAIRRKDDPATEFMTAVGTQIGQFLERMRGVEKIRESEARKAAILEASLDGVITVDELGQVVEFNAAAEDLFGRRRADVVGRRFLDLFVPPRMREQVLAGLASYHATGESDRLGKRFDTVAMKADGVEFPVEVALSPIGIDGASLLTIYVCDATARKHAQQEVLLYQERLRALMADLLLAEERERRRLAVDLHDGLSQTIALAQIKLSALRVSMDGKLTRSLDEIEELIRQTNQAARSISFELSPPVLHDLGLQPAVQWLVENIHARYGIEIDLEDDGLPKPADEKTRVILFRSIRELLINAAKHAGASHVRVRLQREADLLNASVEDDGVGMEPELASVSGSGLISIHERMSHVGGSMRIESAPGRGTKIRLCAPLTNNRPTKEAVNK